MEKKSCCFCLSLREGSSILLIFSVISTLLNFCIFGPKSHFINAVKMAYSIQCILNIPFIIIGMVGVFKRKFACVIAYNYYLLVRLLYNVIIAFTVIAPSVGSDGYSAIIICLLIGATLEIYIIYIFFCYSHQLNKERKEEEEIAALADKV